MVRPTQGEEIMRTTCVLFLAMCVLLPVILADQVQAQKGDEDDSSFPLPFLGEKARQSGYDIPLPLGLGLNFIFINRPTEITRVQAGVNNQGLNDVEFLSFKALAHVRTGMARFDAWFFPFLNVYLLGGYIWNTSQVSTTVNLGSGTTTPIESEGDLEGPTYGFGTTAAGGYKWWFVGLDFNVTKSNLDELSTFIAYLYSVRTGWNGRVGETPTRFYTGAVYWDTKRTIEGTIPVSTPGPVQSIQFAVDQQPVDPMTIVVGTSVTVSPNYWLTLEFQGWRDTQVLVAQATYRFPK
jgi:hypothetical protein